jgi:hypothetical protein
MPRQSFHVFTDLAEARAYRHVYGCGGWIFHDDATGQATIFPPEMPPAEIMKHPLTSGRSGNLVGSA